MQNLPDNSQEAIRILADEIKRLNGKVAALEAYAASIQANVTRDPDALRRLADSCCKEQPQAGSGEFDWACSTLNVLTQNKWCDPRR